MAVGSKEISMDAMRTTVWQIFVAVFITGYLTFYVTMVFNTSHPVNGWIAAPVALALAVLFAAMILYVFLAILRVNPQKVFKWTDALINWSLRRK